MSAAFAASASPVSVRSAPGTQRRRLQRLVARMQRRQLDRDARPCDRPAPARGCGRSRRSRRDRRAGSAPRRRASSPPRPACRSCSAARSLCGARQRLLDRAAHDELPRQHAHAAAQRGADHRLAESRRIMRPIAPGCRPALVQRQHAAGQHERPGRGVHRHAVAVAEMRSASRRRRCGPRSAHRRSRRPECAAAPRRGRAVRRPPPCRARIRRGSR